MKACNFILLTSYPKLALWCSRIRLSSLEFGKVILNDWGCGVIVLLLDFIGIAVFLLFWGVGGPELSAGGPSPVSGSSLAFSPAALAKGFSKIRIAPSTSPSLN